MEEPSLIELGARVTPEALRVYADRLLEKGDAYGEFITLQCARDGGALPGAREEQLRVDVLEPRLRAAVGPHLEVRRWHRGLATDVELLVGDELPLSAPGLLARRAEGVGVERLRVTTVGPADGAPSIEELTPLWRALERGPRFARLSELVLDEGMPSPGPRRLGDLTPLYRAYPGLRVLELHGVDLHLGAIALPELQRFTASLLRPETISSLVHAQWPKLETLELHFGPAPAESEPVFAELLATRLSPALKRVQIRSPWPEFFRAALPRSPLGLGREVEV